jgi:hypothetical protein
MRRALIQQLLCGLLAAALMTVCARPAVSAAADTEPQPPAGEMVVRDVQGGGAQVYACRSMAPATFGWVLVGPKAVLINDDGTDFGTHSAGPTWTALDGSTIAADGTHPLQKIDRANAVPMLLLAVTSSHGSGVLSRVRFVRRADTAGGLPPTSGCDEQHVNAKVARHYSAIYTFYR